MIIERLGGLDVDLERRILKSLQLPTDNSSMARHSSARIAHFQYIHPVIYAQQS